MKHYYRVCGMSQVVNFKKFGIENGGIACIPFAYNDIIYIGCGDKKIYAVNSETGEPIWSFPTGGYVYSSPLIANDTLYIGSFDGYLYALNLDGTLKWKFRTGMGIDSSPVLYKGKLYFGSYDGCLYCISTEGELIWQFRTGTGIDASAFEGVVKPPSWLGSWKRFIDRIFRPEKRTLGYETKVFSVEETKIGGYAKTGITGYEKGAGVDYKATAERKEEASAKKKRIEDEFLFKGR